MPGFSREDVALIAQMTSDELQQWYALTHQTAIPGSAGSIVVTHPTGGGLSASFGSGSILIIAMIILGVVLVARS